VGRIKREKSSDNEKKSFLKSIPWQSVWNRSQRFLKHICLPIVCVFLCLAVLCLSFAWIVSSAVKDKTEDRIYTVEGLTALSGEFDYILVLGCGVYPDQTLTPMLSDRVSVAVSVFQTGICDRILMSGDHRSDAYNEVDPMKNEAVSLGVPTQAIVTDPHGVSTYDSIARLAMIFGGKRVLIVTQEYHLPRALYLAERMGVDAYGVVADQRPYREQLWYDFREMFARCKDVYYAEAKHSFATEIP